jgi:hypothetical protein
MSLIATPQSPISGKTGKTLGGEKDPENGGFVAYLQKGD